MNPHHWIQGFFLYGHKLRLFFEILQVELMQRTVEKSLEHETNRNGLIILKALYGRLVTQDG